MQPLDLSIQDFTYELPEDRIAKYPLPERDVSKILIYQHGKISEDIYRNLSAHLSPHSLLVFNDTKVVEARLLFQKTTGGVIEIFCLEPDEKYPDISTAMSQQEKVVWNCLIGGASKWKKGQILEKKVLCERKEFTIRAKYIEKRTDSFLIGLSWSEFSLTFAEVLHYAGDIPLPPYIKRQAEVFDAERYQTVFAHAEGSVAAPTAGLHFTERIFRSLQEKNIETAFITLHVGAGTFKPVKAEKIAGHEMHSEFITVSKKSIEKFLLHLNKKIIPVGTTSLRTIESLYWLGVKTILQPNVVSLQISQWEPYERNLEISAENALQSLLNHMQKNRIENLITKTQLLIAPPYKPKIANAIITNFHQPQSTLLLLVAALIGEDWRKVYDYALKNNFRFLSYGDGCLLWFS